MTIITDKPEVDQIDAALLVEKSTPTPKGWHDSKKSNWY